MSLHSMRHRVLRTLTVGTDAMDPSPRACFGMQRTQDCLVHRREYL